MLNWGLRPGLPTALPELFPLAISGNVYGFAVSENVSSASGGNDHLDNLTSLLLSGKNDLSEQNVII